MSSRRGTDAGMIAAAVGLLIDGAVFGILLHIGAASPLAFAVCWCSALFCLALGGCALLAWYLFADGRRSNG